MTVKKWEQMREYDFRRCLNCVWGILPKDNLLVLEAANHALSGKGTRNRPLEGMNTRTANREYHELLDYLADSRFYGEVTFYFQNGNIESNRLSERNTKNEIREQMEARKRRETAVTRRGGGTA